MSSEMLHNGGSRNVISGSANPFIIAESRAACTIELKRRITWLLECFGATITTWTTKIALPFTVAVGLWSLGMCVIRPPHSPTTTWNIFESASDTTGRKVSVPLDALNQKKKISADVYCYPFRKNNEATACRTNQREGCVTSFMDLYNCIQGPT